MMNTDETTASATETANANERRIAELTAALDRAHSDLERIFQHPQANCAGVGETNIASIAFAAGARIRAVLKPRPSSLATPSREQKAPRAPTPRTDAETCGLHPSAGMVKMPGGDYVLADFARDLENESDARSSRALSMEAAVRDLELRATQARLAAGIGRRKDRERLSFVLGELERLCEAARAAIGTG